MTLEIYILATVALIFILLVIWIVRLEIKLHKLLCGKGCTLDDSIDTLKSKINQLEKFKAETDDHLDLLDRKSRQAISGIETVRFNPFRGVGEGGNQSFATAIVNENGDGVVISSLYSRDHTSIFSKPIKKSSSPFEMTAEEKEALNKAEESSASVK
jgi:ElaB/YqjD/DUF883 family membrane-anchored ribosome-binding protein